MSGKEIFDDLESLTFEMKARKEELARSLAYVEKEILDIRHYIEFCPLNAYQGYEASRMLKTSLQERRKIKDELQALNRVSVMSVGHIGNGKGRKDLDKLKCKQYHPKVLTGLFGGKDAVHFDIGTDREGGE